MAQQEEEGWPLGLQPLNVRVGLVRNHRHIHELNMGSFSFNTLRTGSSSDSSSDLDTQSTGSFFRDKSITLGSLIGISSILELSRRSTRGRIHEPCVRNKKKYYKTKTWFLSLCSRLGPDAVSMNRNNTPSLGHFLEAERKAAVNNAACRRNVSPGGVYGPDDFTRVYEENPLFVEGDIAPPQCSSTEASHSNGERTTLNRDLLSRADDEPSLLLSCLCGS